MDQRVTHPSKEQVRAYMIEREHARRPPPPPEEIRRSLGWCMASPGPGSALAGFCLLPAAFGQLAAQTALDWYLVPLRAQLAAGMRCKAGTG